MAQWWEALSGLQHLFLYAAIPFTLILLIQTVLTFLGLGGDHDMDTGAGFDADGDGDFDMDGDGGFDAADSHFDVHEHGEPNAGVAGFRFFTIRGIVAFFCIFGWTGYALSGTSMATLPVIIISVTAGFAAMLVIGLMFFSVKRLQSSGNIRYSNAVGQSAEVYIPIPALRIGKGKVMVSIQERLVEAEAVTDEEQKIRTGEIVRVIGNIGNTLIVKR